MARLTPYFHIPNANKYAILMGVSTQGLRPCPIQNCPRIFKLLLERGMDAEPKKRPSMQTIYNIMFYLNSIFNVNDLEPLIENSIPDFQEETKNESASGVS